MTENGFEYNYNDLQLLLTLQEDPMQTYSKIASNLGKSVKTISRWVAKLEENKLFYPVRALLNYKLLNFDIYTLIIEIDNISKVKQLEKVLDEHPYIIYRCRINGAYNGMYINFRSPVATENFYQEFIKFLRDQKFIVEGKFYSYNEQAILTNFNLNFWDKINFDWTFDWLKWESSMNERNIDKVPKIRYSKFNEKLFKRLDKTDIFILRLLDEHAKIKLKDVEIRLKKEEISSDSIQRISERVQFLKTNFIVDYRLNLNPKVLDIYNSLLIDVSCNEKITSKIKSQILLDPPPFPGNFIVRPGGFVWSLNMPASHFSKVSSIIWKEDVNDYKVSFVDYSSSMTYSLWELGYDSITRDWRADEEFILTSQINKLVENSKKKSD